MLFDIEIIGKAGGSTPDQNCQTNEDCDDWRYCASGKCLDFGGCVEDLDCIHPNEMVEDDCVAYQERQEDGTCDKICNADTPCCFYEKCLDGKPLPSATRVSFVCKIGAITAEPFFST
jgi:hypothetical protein